MFHCTHLVLYHLDGQVASALAQKNGADEAADEWDWKVRKVDVRGAVNVYFSLLMAERYVINVGDLDAKKNTLCAKRLGRKGFRVACAPSEF